MTGKGSGCMFSTSERGDRGEEALQPAHAALLRYLAGAGIGDAGVRHPGGKHDILGRHVLRADDACDLDIFFTPVQLHQLLAAHQHRRSEEHTSELQSLMRISYAVFCLTKKK